MPKKSLGQHFLKNKSAIQKIIASLELKSGETIVEIGPGEGALTIPLIEECRKSGCNFFAVEKDVTLADQLRHKGILEVMAGDALKEIPKVAKNIKNYKVVGNIPYYITGKLLRILSELNPPAGGKPTLAVLTIQKEVAERICAHPPETRPIHRPCRMCGMNLLAAATQFWAEPKILMNLKSTDFDPVPDVDSAIIALKTRTMTNDQLQITKKYYDLIKIAFKQPRKTLLNNLSEGFGKNKAEITKILAQIGLKPGIRPQDLDVPTLIKLSEVL